jgi:uncharacterized protein
MSSISIPLAIAGLYTAIFLMGAVALQWLVITTRRRHMVGLGTGGKIEVQQAVRVHGNYIENITLCIPALTLMALTGASSFLLHGIALCMVVGRLLHGLGIMGTPGVSKGRVGGMILTQTSLVLAALVLLVQAFRILL